MRLEMVSVGIEIWIQNCSSPGFDSNEPFKKTCDNNSRFWLPFRWSFWYYVWFKSTSWGEEIPTKHMYQFKCNQTLDVLVSTPSLKTYCIANSHSSKYEFKKLVSKKKMERIRVCKRQHERRQNDRVLLCWIDPRVRKIRNDASSCPGILSRTLRF